MFSTTGLFIRRNKKSDKGVGFLQLPYHAVSQKTLGSLGYSHAWVRTCFCRRDTDATFRLRLYISVLFITDFESKIKYKMLTYAPKTTRTERAAVAPLWVGDAGRSPRFEPQLYNIWRKQFAKERHHERWLHDLDRISLSGYL